MRTNQKHRLVHIIFGAIIFICSFYPKISRQLEHSGAESIIQIFGFH